MIKKFDTSFQSAPPVPPIDLGTPPIDGVKTGKSNTLLYLALGAITLYFGYKFVIKPMMDKRKQEQEQSEN